MHFCRSAIEIDRHSREIAMPISNMRYGGKRDKRIWLIHAFENSIVSKFKLGGSCTSRERALFLSFYSFPFEWFAARFRLCLFVSERAYIVIAKHLNVIRGDV